MGLIVSGSSGNMPTGSGSERLRRAVLQGNNNAQTEILSGSPGHIYTVISIICAEQQNLAGTIQIFWVNGSDTTRILSTTAIGAYETFVFSDRFVLEEDDDLDVQNTTTDCDWYVSYIDQDWT